ncbi:SAM-dependent methyltransferase [Amycolatopsis sp. WGS_07]|uniref:SAM-dependent methyltransferase n=1 Tax=Amycolatopsis sp. WGS_07 TaxID=3076764 RepID=UPI0038736A38
MPYPHPRGRPRAVPSTSDSALRAAALGWRPYLSIDAAPHPARVQNHLLGGSASWTLDRDWCTAAAAVLPSLRPVYRAELRFLVRALRTVRDAGIRRFLVFGDTGPYLNPAVDLVLRTEGSRLVYAAHDEWLLRHWGNFANRHPAITAVPGVFILPGTVLFTDAAQTLLSGEPVCLVLASALETITSTPAAAAALRAYTDRLPAGSVVVATHATTDGLDLDDPDDHDLATRMAAVCEGGKGPRARPPRRTRTRQELARIAAPLAPLDPGIVHTDDWRPSRPRPRPAHSLCLALLVPVRRPDTADHTTDPHDKKAGRP